MVVRCLYGIGAGMLRCLEMIEYQFAGVLFFLRVNVDLTRSAWFFVYASWRKWVRC